MSRDGGLPRADTDTGLCFAAALAEQGAMSRALLGYRRQVREDGIIGAEMVLALLLAIIPPPRVLEPMVAYR